MNLNELATDIYKANAEKGFWDEERSELEMMMLTVSELGEATDALRAGKRPNYIAYQERASVNDPDFKDNFKQNIKDTFEDEIADTIIRLFDMCGGLGIDIDFHIKSKLKYNSMRERLHGKKF